eukprot:3178452-Pleurochrysis_carterae.AAC.2
MTVAESPILAHVSIPFLPLRSPHHAPKQRITQDAPPMALLLAFPRSRSYVTSVTPIFHTRKSRYFAFSLQSLLLSCFEPSVAAAE